MKNIRNKWNRKRVQVIISRRISPYPLTIEGIIDHVTKTHIFIKKTNSEVETVDISDIRNIDFVTNRQIEPEEEKCKKKCKQTVILRSQIQRKILFIVARNKTKRKSCTTAEDIRTELQITDRKLYYHINKLIAKEYIVNKEKAVFMLTLANKGKDYISKFFGELHNYRRSDLQFFDRAHRVTIHLPIDNRESAIIPDCFNVLKKTKSLNWKYPKAIFNDKENMVTVAIHNNSVTLGFREIYSIDSHHVTHIALNRSLPYLKLLREHGFKISRPDYTILEEHHAISNKKLAEYMRKYDFHWKSDKIVFDKSISPNEFELIDRNSSGEDFVKLVKVFEYVVRDKITAEDLSELCTFLPILRKLNLQT